MPKEFYKTIAQMKRYAASELALLIALPVILYLLYASIRYSHPYCLLVCILLLAVLGAALLISRRPLKVAPDERYYAVDIGDIGFEKTAGLFSAEVLTESAAVGFTDYRKTHFLILILNCGGNDLPQIKSLRKNANAAINKKYHLDTEQSMFARNMRLNIYIHDDTSALPDSAYANARRLLDRVEPILNVYIDTSRGKLIIPVIHDCLEVKQVRAYESAVLLLAQEALD